ncbi:hypothetical protein B0H17DRAFT_1146317 [Mycena rosella]|uniref:Cytochrome P450 n=1 Tax=Mycena rosella TaxID=1033263 RepID=A0AAD7CRL9_MYCRO|nr:hypothetical protein B0H17DRAFT_1146317 [Mycena rosella]
MSNANRREGDPMMDDLNNFPYLDCIVHETLCVHLPVIATSRIAVCDNIIPLAAPYTDKGGIMHENLQMKALLSTLVRSFEFALAVPVGDIRKTAAGIVQQPILLSDPGTGNRS